MFLATASLEHAHNKPSLVAGEVQRPTSETASARAHLNVEVKLRLISLLIRGEARERRWAEFTVPFFANVFLAVIVAVTNAEENL